MDFSGICKGMLKFAGALCLCTGLVLACPKDSQAAARQAEVKTRSSYVVKIEAPSVDVYTYASEFSGRQGQVMRGQTYEVLSGANQGWSRSEPADGKDSSEPQAMPRWWKKPVNPWMRT